MRLLFILFIVFCCTFTVSGQNMPMSQQYGFDNMLLNPAFCGMGEGTSLKLMHRQQWVGVSQAPHTSSVLLTTRPQSQPLGLGAMVYTDANGPTKMFGFQATFGYHLLLASNRYNRTILSFALSFHGISYSLDETGFNRDLYDPIINYTRRTTFIPDFNAGMVFTMQGMMLGVSADHLMPVRNVLFNHAIEGMIPTYMNFHAGYIIELQRGFKVKPLINVRTDYKAHNQMELGAKLSYGYGKKIRSRYLRNPNEFWIGFNYRQTFDYLNVAPLCFQPTIGVKVGSFMFAYQFELGLTSIQLYSYGSHQLMIGIKLFSDKMQDWGRNDQPIFNEEF